MRYLTVLFLFFALPLFSQQNVGIGTTNPQAALDVTSSDQGILVPRINLVARNIATPVVNPTYGELVFNLSDTGTDTLSVQPGFYYWDNTQWVGMIADVDSLYNRIDSLLAAQCAMVVGSIAELRALPGDTVCHYIQTIAYYDDRLGGANAYVKANLTNPIDNGGSIIIADDGTVYQMVNQDRVYLKQFGARGDGVTGDHKEILMAFDYALAQNIPVYAEAGTFIIDRLDGNTGAAAVRINVVNAPDQNFSLIGAGKGLTIFKEQDGKTEVTGRYTKLFYVYLNQNNNVGDIVFKDFTLDKNGRSNTLPGGDSPSDYSWEQAHAIGFNGSANSPDKLRSLTFKNIHIVDKIGGGINISSMRTQFGPIIVENVSDEPFIPRFGQRGTLEIGAFSTKMVFDKVNVVYAQIEPVSSGAATAATPRKSFFTNCNLGKLEYTESNSAAIYSEVSAMNCFFERVTLRNITFTLMNTFINEIDGFVNSPSGKFTNCQIKLPYDSIQNSIRSIYPTRYVSQNYDSNIEFLNCDFIIDSDDPTITPTGYIVKNTAKILVGSPQMNCIINNCNFDKRAAGSVDNYGNSNFFIKNSKLAGTNIALLAGTYNNFNANLHLENNDYSQITGITLRINDVAANYSINIKERLNIEEWSVIKSSSGGFYETNIKSSPVLLADAIPASGFFIKGTTLEIRAPGPGEYAFYKCVTSGNPGVWKGYGLLEN